MVFLKNISLENLKIQKIENTFHFFLWKRWAPDNRADPSYKILKILDTEPIPTRKHERHFGIMVPVSTRNL